MIGRFAPGPRHALGVEHYLGQYAIGPGYKLGLTKTRRYNWIRGTDQNQLGQISSRPLPVVQQTACQP